jgi:hypothetical protein
MIMKTRTILFVATALCLAVLGCKVDPLPPEPQYVNPYDPRSPNFNDELDLGEWTLLQKREHGNPLIPATVLNNKTCYLLGGIDASNAVSNGVYSFFLPDTSIADSIHLFVGLPMLFARKSFSAIAYNGIIYAFGGDMNGTTEAFNLLENRWFSLGTLPANDMYAGTAAIQFHDSIIVLGGKSLAGSASNKAWLYKPSVNLWSLFVTLPVRIVFPTVQILENKFYMIGGFDSAGHATSKIYVLDLTNGSWSLFPDTLKEARGNSVSVVRQSRIYVFGGQNEYGAFSSRVDEIRVSSGRCVRKGDVPYGVLPYDCFYDSKKMKLICGGRDQPLMVLEFDLLY